MKDLKIKKAYLAAVSYSIIVGLSFMFGKIGLDYSDPLDLLAYRFTAGFLAILFPIVFKLIKIDINKEMIKKILPLAIFYPLGFFGFQAFGLKYTQSSEAGMIFAAGPVITMLLASYFLKEKTTTLQKISIILSVLGVIYITIKKGFSFETGNIKGIVLLLISVLSFAIYSVMARKFTKDFSSMELSYVMVSISFISFNVLAIARHLILGDIRNFILPLKHFEFIIAVFYLGVLSLLITSILLNYVLSKIEASRMSVFSNLSTVISIVAGLVFLNEEIFYYHIIGSLLIILGVIGVNFFGQKQNP